MTVAAVKNCPFTKPLAGATLWHQARGQGNHQQLPAVRKPERLHTGKSNKLRLALNSGNVAAVASELRIMEAKRSRTAQSTFTDTSRLHTTSSPRLHTSSTNSTRLSTSTSHGRLKTSSSKQSARETSNTVNKNGRDHPWSKSLFTIEEDKDEWEDGVWKNLGEVRLILVLDLDRRLVARKNTNLIHLSYIPRMKILSGIC